MPSSAVPALRETTRVSSHNFTLALGASELTPDLEDALFEAGCDDATPSQSGRAVFLEFDRDAPSLREAILSAIEQVRLAGCAVRRVVTEDLVNAAQIAERLARSRESVRLLINGERGPGGFPAPEHHVGGRPLWSWGEVARWLRESRVAEVEADDGSGSLLDAINSALGLARAEGSLTDSGVRRISGLLGERVRKTLAP